MKKYTVRERLLASTMIGGATLVALSAAPAFAADAPKDSTTVGEVVVTGSRIPHPNLTSVSPLTTVGAQDIKLQGVQNVEDLINSLPQAFADFGAMESNGATGTATVNLRNLGDKRTLVLVDGKRLQPGDPLLPVADLNFIPSALVDRVDIVTGGASAVYGSDAVAGVVNFIMKKNFEGLRIDVQYGFDQHNQHNSQIKGDVATTVGLFGSGPKLPTGSITDGARTSVSIIGGSNSADGNGNVTFYFNYQHTDPVLEKNRDWSACSTATNTGTVFQYCGGSSTSFPGRFNFGSGSKTIDSSGVVHPFTAANFYNFAPLNYLQRPDERYTAGEFSHYTINPHVDLYTSFMFMHDLSDAQIAGSGAFYGTAYTINCDNPLLTASEATNFCGANAGLPVNKTGLIGRRDVEGTGRVSDIQHFDYRMVIGARGEITDGWNYDVYGQYGHSDLQERELGYFSISHTNNALDVVLIGGVPQCASAAARAQGCVPWNIFNNPAHPGGVTAAQLKYLEETAMSSGQASEQIVSGNITGDLGKYGIKSPWAKDGVGVSLGGEYRREALDTEFDGLFSSGDLAGLGGAPKSGAGSFDVKEAFGEVRVPLIQDAPMAKEISFEGGYRYADYSSSGHVESYKLALDWAITSDIRLRGSLQRAVRAPNVNELFTPLAPGLASGTDPCAGAAPHLSAAACANEGVSAAQYGHITQCVSAQCNIEAGGNPLLKPETSDTQSLGAVFTPTFLPGFNLSVDWFDIKVKDVISGLGLATVLNTCAATPSAIATAGQTYCSLIHRDPTVANSGSLFGAGFVTLPLINANQLHTSGVDMESNYHIALSDWGMGDHGSVNFNLVGTYTSKLEARNPAAGTTSCAGLFGTTCGTPTPKWRSKFRATWVTPWNVSISGQWRYIAGTKLDFTEDNGGIATDRAIPAYNYFDLSGEWRIRDRMTLHAGVNNLFDKDPPILDSNSYGIAAPPFGNGNTYPQVYDSLGRTIFVGITADF